MGFFIMGLTNTSANTTADTELDALVAHDAVDSGSPLKIGGRAVDPTALPTAVAANDRSDMYTSLQGEQLTYLSRLIAGEDQTNNLQSVAIKPLAVSTYSFTSFQNYGANATLNVKASAGNVYGVSCYNANAAARWIQLHNTATTPGGGAVPLFSFLVPAGSQVVIDTDWFGLNGMAFSNGIAFAFSTAANSYTAGAAADQSTQVNYK